MKMPIQRILAAVLISAIVSMGCATSYSPQEPGRIYFLTSGKGDLVFAKDGKTYNAQWTSSDIREAVAGNQAAEEHARTFVRRQRIAGTLAILAGVGLVLGFAVLAFSAAEPAGAGPGPVTDDHGDTARNMRIAAFTMLLGSVASRAGGVTVGATSEAHLYDAINIYNDDVFRRSQSALPTLERDSVQPAANSR
jgi:hypothetical protein